MPLEKSWALDKGICELAIVAAGGVKVPHGEPEVEVGVVPNTPQAPPPVLGGVVTPNVPKGAEEAPALDWPFASQGVGFGFGERSVGCLR